MRRTLAPKEQLLESVTLFKGLPAKELRRVASLVNEGRLPAGWPLMREGQAGSECYVLVEGTATVTINDERVAVLEPGDTVGEMALLDPVPRSATVHADTDLSLLVINRESFTELLAIPQVAREIVRSLAGRLRRAEGAPEHW